MNTFVTIMLVTMLIAFDGHECKTVEFIFGDSLCDVGNNIRLPRTLAKPNLPWYGIDFGNGLPNGRFNNGRTVTDIIGDTLGLERPPPFLDSDLDENIILEKGVNYASGGGGILNETGRYFIQRFCFDKQIELFKGSQELIKGKIGENKSNEFFQDALYLVAFGSNDFINNYLMPVYGDPYLFNDQTFVQYLVRTFQKQLETLHHLGARKMVVFGVAPLGCIPLQRAMTKTGACQENSNKLSQSFNHATENMVKKLSKTLPNANYKFGDTYDFVYDLVTNPLKYGFTNSDTPCCSYWEIRPSLTCTPASTLCKDRSKYVFWDEYHPSDSANEIIAKDLFNKLGLISKQDGDNQNSTAPAMAPFAHI